MKATSVNKSGLKFNRVKLTEIDVTVVKFRVTTRKEAKYNIKNQKISRTRNGE